MINKVRVLAIAALLLAVAPASAAPTSAKPSATATAQPYRPQQRGHFLQQGEVGYGMKSDKHPENYPLPIPPGASAGLAQNVVTTNGTGYYLRIHAQHSQGDLVDWYMAQLRAGGWKVEIPVPSGRGTAVSCSKANGPSALIMFYSDAKGETDVITNVTP